MIIVLYLESLDTKTDFLLKTSVLSLFFKKSLNFINFSLDILIKWIFYKGKKECTSSVELTQTRMRKRIDYTSHYIHGLGKL